MSTPRRATFQPVTSTRIPTPLEHLRAQLRRTLIIRRIQLTEWLGR